MPRASFDDLTHAARLLRHSPVFTLTAILSLAAGIGGSTAVFTLVNGVLLRSPEGIEAPHRLVDIGRTDGGSGFDNFSYANYLDYRDRTTLLSGLAAYRLDPQPIGFAGAGDSSERVYGQLVSANYFEVAGTRPALGRLLQAEDDRPGADTVAVISHAFWVRRFNGDPDVLSRWVTLNGSPAAIVGVAPDGFRGTSVLAPDLWVPVGSYAELWPGRGSLLDRRASSVVLVGRLAAGASVEQVQAQMDTIAGGLARSYPESNRDQGVRVLPAQRLPGPLGTAAAGFFALLTAIVGLVLLIACVNVAGMLLARGTAREREMAVRLALGASRWTIVRQMLVETLLLFVLGAAGGLLTAVTMTRVLVAFLPSLPLPLALDLPIDARVLGFSLAVSLATGLLTGLAPALRAARPNLLPSLKAEDGGRAGRLRLRSVLVAGQVALSVLVLVVAALFLRAVGRAAALDPGFDPANVEVLTLDFTLARHDAASARRLTDDLLARVRAVPGVRSATLAADLPLDGDRMGLGGIRLPGRALPGGAGLFGPDWNIVAPDYFTLMGIPIVRGREFRAEDREGTRAVAVVNESMAEQLWPGEDAVGQHFELVDADGLGTPIQVVGIARDSKYRWLTDANVPFAYVPFSQQYRADMSLLVKSETAGSAVPAIRSLLDRIDPQLPVVHANRLERVAAIGLLPQRAAATVAGAFGFVGLLLAALGIYGVTAFGVGRRRREIGVRMAIGATPRDVVMLVVRGGVVTAAAGLAVGLVGAAAAARLLSGLLFGVSSRDVPAFAAVSAVLAVAAVLACYAPARRAARIEPFLALRRE